MLNFESYAPQVWNVWWKMYFHLLPYLHQDQNIHPAFISTERPWQEGTGCVLHIKYLSDRLSGMRRRLEMKKWNHGSREETGTVICLVTNIKLQSTAESKATVTSTETKVSCFAEQHWFWNAGFLWILIKRYWQRWHGWEREKGTAVCSLTEAKTNPWRDRDSTACALKVKWRWLPLRFRCTGICQGKTGECSSCQQINTQTTSECPASWLNEGRKPLKEHFWAQLYLLLLLLLLTSSRPSTPG